MINNAHVPLKAVGHRSKENAFVYFPAGVERHPSSLYPRDTLHVEVVRDNSGAGLMPLFVCPAET